MLIINLIVNYGILTYDQVKRVSENTWTNIKI